MIASIDRKQDDGRFLRTPGVSAKTIGAAFDRKRDFRIEFSRLGANENMFVALKPRKSE
jgi:hypothetical protein